MLVPILLIKLIGLTLIHHAVVPLPPLTVTVTTVQEGASLTREIQDVQFSRTPASGTYTITVPGAQTVPNQSNGCNPFCYAGTTSTLQATATPTDIYNALVAATGYTPGSSLGSTSSDRFDVATTSFTSFRITFPVGYQGGFNNPYGWNWWPVTLNVTNLR